MENNVKLYAIAFNVLKSISDEISKAPESQYETRSYYVNLQYTMKVVYDRHEKAKHELENLSHLKKDSPLYSTIHGKSFTADEAMDFLKNISR